MNDTGFKDESNCHILLADQKKMKSKIQFIRYRLLSVIFLLSVTVHFVSAQDATFSQFYFNQLYVNPAFTGINPGLRAGVNYRALWPNIPSKFPTYSVAIDAQDLALSSGIGLHAWSDTEGEGYLRTQCISGLYSYRMILSPKNWVFQAGFQTSIINKKIDWSQLVFSDQLHPLFGITGPSANPTPYQQSTTFADFTAGALIKGNQRSRIKNIIATYTFGAAIHHLVQPDESILGSASRLPKNIVIHAGAVIPVRYEVKKYKILLVPNLMWEHQSTMSEFIASFNVMMKPLFAGLSYRNQTPLIADLKRADAIIINFGLAGDKNKESIVYKIGYSYDLTISDLRSNTAGTHEIALIIEFRDFKFNNSGSPKRKLECPNF